MNRRDIVPAMERAAFAYHDIQPNGDHTLLTVIDDAQSGVQGYLRRQEDTLWITFRGTSSCIDWKTDFHFFKKIIPYNNNSSKIRVHEGFINAYKSPHVRDKIHRYVTAEISKIKIEGHSYGAALSILCAVDLQYNFPDRDIEVIVFGCPRVGNRAFQKSYDQRVFKTIRVENGNDLVTKIPFAWMGYRHVGTRLHIGPLRLPLVVSVAQHPPHAYYRSLVKSRLF